MLETNAFKARTNVFDTGDKRAENERPLYIYYTFLQAKSILTSLLLTVSYIYLLLVRASSIYSIIVQQETVYTT